MNHLSFECPCGHSPLIPVPDMIERYGGETTVDHVRAKARCSLAIMYVEIVEMLGSGNGNRTGPASTKAPKKPLDFDDVQLFFEGDYSKRMYLQIQREALEVFPALKHLDTKYYNATGFLSYHESEILTLSLLRLKAMGVPAYGVHDCVVVKQSDKHTAVETYRSVTRDYVVKHQKANNHPILNIEVSLTIEELNKDKVKLAGFYE